MDVLELDAWIATLEADAARCRAELEVIDQRLPILLDLRATFEIPNVEAAPPPKATRSKPAGKSGWPKDGEHVVCPDCGQSFAKAGYGPHRRKHAAPTPPKLAAVPPPTPTIDTRTVYRCGSDDLEFGSIVDITHHTLTEHDRRPTAGEKLLVTPDSARSSA